MKVLRMIGWLLLMMILVVGGIYVYNLWLNQTFVTTIYTMETAGGGPPLGGAFRPALVRVWREER